MSLNTADIKKTKRLSLKEAKLPVKQKTPVELNTAPQSHFNEEVVYMTMVKRYPLLEALVASLGLVIDTDEKRPLETAKLWKITEDILTRNTSYTKEEIICRIQLNTKVSRERAENGFNKMIEAGIIEATGQGAYYLKGTAPF